MSTDPLLVVSVDYLANHQYVVYFSNNTYAIMSAAELADCVPEYKRRLDTETGGRNQKPRTPSDRTPANGPPANSPGS